MNEHAILTCIETQRGYFKQGATLPLEGRRKALERLYQGIEAMEAEIHDALEADLGKSASESYLTETGILLSEIRYMLRHMRAFAKPRRARVALPQFPAKCRVIPGPYGTVLVISPWNYPFSLALTPAVNAIAAGNTVVIKPSEYAPETSKVLEALVSRFLPPELAVVIPGDHRESSFLLDQHFDSIFFTGGGEIGRIVMEKAAVHLTPVTLELGGKSPCIVDKSADLNLAARRIVFGKLVNCGQTCVAPDYLYVEESVRAPLLEAIRAQITLQYGKAPLENPQYGRIINRRHFDRLCGLIDSEQVVIGGEQNPDTLQIAPTVLDGVHWDDPVMKEEIFGPILPVLTFQTLEEAVETIAARPHPLALYLFSRDKQVQQRVMTSLQFGGGCVNDTILHLVTSHMGFGGVGGSGMGAYHGKAGFDAFTHYKSTLTKGALFDFSMRYAPYTPQKDRLARRFLR